MRRRLFTLLSALSLLGGVAVVLLWAWAYAAGRTVRLGGGAYATGDYAVTVDPAGGGRFLLEVSPYPAAYLTWMGLLFEIDGGGWGTTAPASITDAAGVTIVPLPAATADESPSRNPAVVGGSDVYFAFPENHRPFPGVRWVDNIMSGTGMLTSREVSIDCWLPALAFAVMPGVWLVRARGRWRRLAGSGKCGQCGYDLRASPDRCPECGTRAAVVEVSS